MANISKEVNIEMLEKLPDGTYKKKNPSTRAELVKENTEKRFVSDLEKAEIEKIKDKSDKTYVDEKVKTDVPLGANFENTEYTAGENIFIDGTIINAEGETIADGIIPPEGIKEGRLWIDTSEDVLIGTIFEDLDERKADKSYVDNKVKKDVPVDADFTNTTYLAGENITIDENNSISSSGGGIGLYAFTIRGGDLILEYTDGDAVPDFKINPSGELIYNTQGSDI